MILYAEKPRTESLTDCLYRFWQKDIHNVAIWPEDSEVDNEKLKRLRALGMNMVFFDTDAGLPYADCVALDNKKAVRELCSRVAGSIGYIGWQDGPAYSTLQREKAFIEATGAEVLTRLSWRDKNNALESLTSYIKTHRASLPDVIFYCDQECGVMLSNVFRRLKLRQRLIGIDAFADPEGMCSCVCTQDLSETVKQIFTCLHSQNDAPYEWSAKMYLTAGILTK